MIKSILKDFGFYGIAPFLPKVANIFILPLVTPFLSTEDYYIWGLILAYVNFFQIFLTLSLQVNLSNSFFKSEKQYKWLWRQIYGFWKIWSVVFSGFLVLLLYFIVPNEARSQLWLLIFLIITPTLLFGPVEFIANTYYQLNKKPKNIVIRSVIVGLLSSILFWFFVSKLKLGYLSWFYTSFIAEFLLKLSWYIDLKYVVKFSPIYNFNWKTLRKALKVSLPLVPHGNALYILNQSDRIVLDKLSVPNVQIGSYNAAYSLANIFDSLANAFSITVIPYVYEMFKTSNFLKARFFFAASQILFLTILLMFSLFAKEIVHYLFRNPDFHDIYSLSVLIVASMCFKPMYMASTLTYFYNENTKTMSLYSFIAGALNILLNLMFIPFIGIEGAAISTVIGYLFLAYANFFRKGFKALSINYYPVRWIVVSVIVVIGSYYISMFPFFYRMLILLIFLFIVFVGLFAFRQRIKHIFK